MTESGERGRVGVTVLLVAAFALGAVAFVGTTAALATSTSVGAVAGGATAVLVLLGGLAVLRTASDRDTGDAADDTVESDTAVNPTAPGEAEADSDEVTGDEEVGGSDAEANADATGSDASFVSSDEHVSSLLETAALSRISAERLIDDEEYDEADEHLERGIEACERAAQLDDEHGLGRREEIVDYRSALQELAERADAGGALVRAVDLRDGVREALHANVLETATQSLAELEAVLDEEVDQESDAVEELRADVHEYGRRLERQAGGQVDSHLDTAVSAREDGEIHPEDGEYDHTYERVEEGLEACERAAALDQTHDLGRADDIEEVRASLEALADRAEALETLVTDAAEQRDRARRALQTENYDTVQEALDELEATLDDLETYEGTAAVVTDYRAALEDIGEDAAAKRAESRVNGILISAESARSRAEEFVEAENYDRAETHLESALDSLAEAEDLVERYDLGRMSMIVTKREAVELLLADVSSWTDDELAEYLEAAEAAVARGIERRDADDHEAAVEAFEDAHDEYEAALDLATTRDLPEHWEVEQRHSMVEEYLEVVRDELAERRQAVRTDLDRTLDEVESLLAHAEQHEEVDDPVSARESLATAVTKLDEATQLVETGTAGDDLRGRYEELVDQVAALDERLPDEEASGEHRTRDLVESLQVLATKLGESPRPAFVNAYGEYPADAYLKAFGSWPDVLEAANLDPVDEDARERRTYSQVEVLDALVELADDLGRPPSKTEMNEKGSVSSTTVESRFDDWETALELAGIGGRGADDRDARQQADSVVDDETVANGEPDSNELAELYEAFASLESVLDALLTTDPSVEHGDGSPLAEWYDAVYDYWAGDGPDDAPNYGEQQYRRNDFSMPDYRTAHGDGDRVTTFGAIETRPLRESHREVLEERDVIDPDETFSLPVAPKTGTRLPVAVRSEEELSKALDLLAEFPDWPNAELPPGESVDDDATSERDDGEQWTINEPDEYEPDDRDGPTRAELLDVIRELDREHDRVPKATDVQHDETRPSVAAFRDEFGSWDDALEAADIDKEAELLDELRRVASELGTVPKTTEMNEHGVYSAGMYARFFGSWSAAKDRVDFDTLLDGERDDGTDDSGESADDASTPDDPDDPDNLVEQLLDDMGMESDTGTAGE